MQRRRGMWFGVFAVFLAGGVLLSACEDDGTTTQTSQPTRPGGVLGTVPTGIDVQLGFSTPASGQIQIVTAIGKQVLADAGGFTLYTSANDTPDSGVSACHSSCAQVFRPFAVTAAPTGPAEATGVFGTITRSDGSIQATYRGMPLYRFINDAAPGDANGDNFGGIWDAAVP